MRRYEVVFVLAPTLTDDEVEQAIESFTKTARDKGAEVISVDKWGKRRLAFRVGKHTDGYYVVLTLEEPSGAAVAELERRFKVSDSVIRFLSVRTDLDLKRAEKFKKEREARRAKRPAPPREHAAYQEMEEALAAAEPTEAEEE
ncbi:MAG TPA: 30S ribosomal protein S6 [Acidobacteriota bacterium]|nr:30S ribosomal protein S6 [Acidobacteriota bacterium]